MIAGFFFLIFFTGGNAFTVELRDDQQMPNDTITTEKEENNNGNCGYNDVVKFLNLNKGNDNYTLTRPVKNYNTVTEISHLMKVFGILDMVKTEQLFISYIWVFLRWKNEHISWNPKEFCGLESITIPTELLWMPDLIIEEMTEKDRATTNPFLTIYSNGNVSFRNDHVVVSTCKMNVYKFPFDIQSCNLSFKSMTHTPREINLKTLENDKVITRWSKDLIETQDEWEFLNITVNNQTSDLDSFQSMLVYTMESKQLANNLILTEDVIKQDSGGEKLSFKVTVLLAVTVMQLILNDILPSSSNKVPLIGMKKCCHCAPVYDASSDETESVTKEFTPAAPLSADSASDRLALGQTFGLSPRLAVSGLDCQPPRLWTAGRLRGWMDPTVCIPALALRLAAVLLLRAVFLWRIAHGSPTHTPVAALPSLLGHHLHIAGFCHSDSQLLCSSGLVGCVALVFAHVRRLPRQSHLAAASGILQPSVLPARVSVLQPTVPGSLQAVHPLRVSQASLCLISQPASVLCRLALGRPVGRVPGLELLSSGCTTAACCVPLAYKHVVTVLGVDLRVIALLSPPLMPARLPAPPLPVCEQLGVASALRMDGSHPKLHLRLLAVFPWRVARFAGVHASRTSLWRVRVLQPVAPTLCLALPSCCRPMRPAGCYLAARCAAFPAGLPRGSRADLERPITYGPVSCMTGSGQSSVCRLLPPPPGSAFALRSPDQGGVSLGALSLTPGTFTLGGALSPRGVSYRVTPYIWNM
nr:PREDICTED: uncharacterized protein LOC102202259 [Pundamilia nyererei]